MAFSLKDVRFTTRRTAGGDDAGESVEKTLHPRLVRDRSMLPKVAIAIQYFESMVGHERQELDTEVLVQFFGDHKLARCMVACLARSYRYRSPRFEDVVTRTALRRLQRAGLDSPKSLRFQLYDHLNGDANGFLRTMEREATYGTMEARYRLRQGDLERLLYLDADEHAVLARHCG
ncbi:MAG: hypothetical protein ACRDJN_01575, partial [Chloroflexota bacterium]